MIAKALRSLPPSDSTSASIAVRSANHQWLSKRKPDFISVTRGPGLLPSLSTGLQTAKGLAVAWQVPLVGVNHMQAHALTPRLVHALEAKKGDGRVAREPTFPFLSLLVSGGHTMLVHSKRLTNHKILAGTTDIAIGDLIDKAARLLLPQEIIEESEDVMYGRLLEEFAFPDGDAGVYDYNAPATRAEELSRKPSKWGWAFAAPLAETRSGSKSKAMEFSFSGLGSAVERTCRGTGTSMTMGERVDLAKEVMRVAFDHLGSRVIMALKTLHQEGEKISTLVVSGGVASNKFLREVYVILHSFVFRSSYSDPEDEDCVPSWISEATPTFA